jgi:glycerol-3-phosphate acyltransferase PlsX
MRVGIDILGGDYFPVAPLEGVLLAQKEIQYDRTKEIVLIGDEALIQQFEEEHQVTLDFPRIHASEAITMEDNPAKAIMAKRNSSIVVGLQALKEGKIDAFISAGNTGAIIAGSVLILGTIPGVIRPTLGVIYPPLLGSKPTLLCDVGANTDCKPEYLAQFAQLGSIYMRSVYKVERPEVAILNIGEEATKGNQVVRTAYQLMEKDRTLNFVGNIEGRHIIKNKVDVLVCDGFVGNILLKYGESFYLLFKQKLPDDPLLDKFNFEKIGGLPLIGVEGIVIIGHGISGPKAFKNMILRAFEVAERQLISHLKEQFINLYNNVNTESA